MLMKRQKNNIVQWKQRENGTAFKEVKEKEHLLDLLGLQQDCPSGSGTCDWNYNTTLHVFISRISSEAISVALTFKFYNNFHVHHYNNKLLPRLT